MKTSYENSKICVFNMSSFFAAYVLYNLSVNKYVRTAPSSDIANLNELQHGNSKLAVKPNRNPSIREKNNADECTPQAIELGIRSTTFECEKTKSTHNQKNADDNMFKEHKFIKEIMLHNDLEIIDESSENSIEGLANENAQSLPYKTIRTKKIRTPSQIQKTKEINFLKLQLLRHIKDLLNDVGSKNMNQVKGNYKKSRNDFLPFISEKVKRNDKFETKNSKLQSFFSDFSTRVKKNVEVVGSLKNCCRFKLMFSLSSNINFSNSMMIEIFDSDEADDILKINYVIFDNDLVCGFVYIRECKRKKISN